MKSLYFNFQQLLDYKILDYYLLVKSIKIVPSKTKNKWAAIILFIDDILFYSVTVQSHGKNLKNI